MRDRIQQPHGLHARRHTGTAARQTGSAALSPPRRLTLEQAIAYIQDDELVEVTPKVVRIRKRFLDPHERKRQARRAEVA
jgi:predicted membrane GTPase involved in stress response